MRAGDVVGSYDRSSMTIRPATAADLTDLNEIDGTIESPSYAHVDQTVDLLNVSWRLEWRPAREKLVRSNPLSDDTAFMLRQIVSGHDEGVALTAEHDGVAVALLLAQPDPARGVMAVLDCRVDSDHRRQGLAMVMLYQLVERAKDADLRACYATTKTNNAPAARLLEKLGWDLCGLDTRRDGNHDLIKESATLLWYYAIQ